MEGFDGLVVPEVGIWNMKWTKIIACVYVGIMFLYVQSIHIYKGHKIMNFTNLTELNSELNSPLSVYACMYVCMWFWLSATCAGGIFSSYQLAHILHLYS